MFPGLISAGTTCLARAAPGDYRNEAAAARRRPRAPQEVPRPPACLPARTRHTRHAVNGPGKMASFWQIRGRAVCCLRGLPRCGQAHAVGCWRRVRGGVAGSASRQHRLSFSPRPSAGSASVEPPPAARGLASGDAPPRPRRRGRGPRGTSHFRAKSASQRAAIGGAGHYFLSGLVFFMPCVWHAGAGRFGCSRPKCVCLVEGPCPAPLPPSSIPRRLHQSVSVYVCVFSAPVESRPKTAFWVACADVRARGSCREGM